MAYGNTAKKMYLKDYVTKAPGQELEVQIVDRAPGLVQKQTRDGATFYLQNFTFKIVATGQELTEGFFPKTKAGKANITVEFLSSQQIGNRVIAYMNGDYLNFKEADTGNQDFPPSEEEMERHHERAENRGEGVPNTPPPQRHNDSLAHDYKLGLAGIVQAHLIRGMTAEEISGGEMQGNPAAEDWVKWIRAKSIQLSLEHAS